MGQQFMTRIFYAATMIIGIALYLAILFSVAYWSSRPEMGPAEIGMVER